MTKIIDIKDPALTAGELTVGQVEAVRQVWRDGWSYVGFWKHPRPKSGLVFVCSDIQGTFEMLDGEKISVSRGDVFYAPRGIRYRVSWKGGKAESRVDTYTLHFHLYDQTGEEILLSDRATVLKRAAASRLAFDAEAVWRAVHLADMPQNVFKIKVKFLALLDEIIDETRETDAGIYPIRAGVDALCNEWDRNEPMSRYAELCGVCESYFYLLFKKWSGMSPVEYRNRIRMNNAGSLLINSDLSIGEIAALVGFADPFYFSRVFRRAFSMSPLQYRKHGTKDERGILHP
ncbi:MAG: helix-turn-helix transcriptional regulator [Ruminococcaceae bacterium]|nr:helix-turn-helix transcriptional regulator [Oscillospiraceae bacterium]